MLIRTQIFQNRFTKASEMVTINFGELIQNPAKNIPKEQLPMFNCWHNETGKRGSQNVTGISALVLDYDSGFTMDEFYDRYYNYKWLLYTSSSHKPDFHKFRVIIPLMSMISKEEYTSDLRKALEYKFPESDPTAFYTDHAFFLPAAPQFGQYQYYYNEAKLMNPKIFTSLQIGLTMQHDLTKKIRTDRTWTPDIERLQKEAEVKISDIVNRGDGSGRYHDLLKLTYKYSKYGISKSFLSQLLNGYKNKNQILGSIKY
jgi:hypothetical protein